MKQKIKAKSNYKARGSSVDLYCSVHMHRAKARSKSRSRIRKKLGLQKEESLDEFLQKR